MIDKENEIALELRNVGATLLNDPDAGAKEIVKEGMCLIATREETDNGVYVVYRLDKNMLPDKLKSAIFEKKAIDKP
jgi:hypothetical protein